MDGAAICDAALAVVERSRQSYQTKYDNWFNDVKELTKKRDEAKEAFTKADIALANTPTNSTETAISRGELTVGRTCADFTDDDCYNRCHWRTLTTPGGRKSIWYYDLNKNDCNDDISKWMGYKKCICHFVGSWNTNDVTEKKVIYEQAENNLKNRINEEPKYKDENPPTVQCCSNDLDCNQGICKGIIQDCKLLINIAFNKENENKILDSIKELKIIFNDYIKNFNQNVELFKNNYNTFNNINFNQTNINIIYNQIKSVYDYITIIYNQIEKNIVNILIYFNSLFTNNQRISDNSNLKEESILILNEALPKSKIATNTFRNTIVEQYFKVKVFFDDIEREKNNYNSMLLKKSLMDTNINNFNNNIESINNIYSDINTISLTSDADLEQILELKNKAINIFNNQVKNYKNSINEKFNEIKILSETISPNYIYFNTANNIYSACENMNIFVNIKFIELEEIIIKIQNIINEKKTNYEKKKNIEKKIYEDKNILYTLEEDENLVKNNKIIKPIILSTNNVDTPVKLVSQDNTIYIIIGIFIIVFIFYIYK